MLHVEQVGFFSETECSCENFGFSFNGMYAYICVTITPTNYNCSREKLQSTKKKNKTVYMVIT